MASTHLDGMPGGADDGEAAGPGQGRNQPRFRSEAGELTASQQRLEKAPAAAGSSRVMQ